MKKHITTVAAVCVLVLLGPAGCKDASVGPEPTGSIEGVVLDFATTQPLAGVSVTTSPPTQALVTDAEGRFSIDEVVEGSYTITASKPGFKTNSVSVAVRESRAAQASVLLKEDDEDTLPSLSVDIVNWATRTSVTGDSAYVDIEYQVRNTGAIDIGAYEVYFRIQTPSETFLAERDGEDLGTGQSDVGSFEKYTRGERAQDVSVENVWFVKKDDAE